MKTRLIILFWVCWVSAFAQPSTIPFFQRSYKPYPAGGSENNGFAILSDGLSSVMAGTYYQGSSSGITIFKIDEQGLYVWVKQYKMRGFKNERCLSIAKTSQGNYIITGFMENSDNVRQLMLLSITASGSILWARKIKPFSSLPMSHGLNVQVDKNDGSILITGFSSDMDYNDKTGFLIKTDALGKAIWVNQFQSNGFITENDMGEHVTIAYDLFGKTMGYLLTGSGTAGAIGSEGQATLAAYFDPSGNMQWNKIIKDRNAGDFDCSAGSVFDPNTNLFYILRNSSAHHKFGITQLDIRGNTILSQIYTSPFPGIYGLSIKNTDLIKDGGIVVGGVIRDEQNPENDGNPFIACFTLNLIPLPEMSYKYDLPAYLHTTSLTGDYFAPFKGQLPNVHTYDMLAVNTSGYSMVSGKDAITGSNPHLVRANHIGTTLCHESALRITGDIYLTAATNTISVNKKACGSDTLAVTTNPPMITYLYPYSALCDNSGGTTSASSDAGNSLHISAYPNPVKDYLNVELRYNQAGTLRLSNILGQIVREQDIEEAFNEMISFSVENLLPGLYTLTFNNANGSEGYRTIVVE